MGGGVSLQEEGCVVVAGRDQAGSGVEATCQGEEPVLLCYQSDLGEKQQGKGVREKG